MTTNANVNVKPISATPETKGIMSITMIQYKAIIKTTSREFTTKTRDAGMALMALMVQAVTALHQYSLRATDKNTEKAMEILLTGFWPHVSESSRKVNKSTVNRLKALIVYGVDPAMISWFDYASSNLAGHFADMLTRFHKANPKDKPGVVKKMSVLFNELNTIGRIPYLRKLADEKGIKSGRKDATVKIPNGKSDSTDDTTSNSTSTDDNQHVTTQEVSGIESRFPGLDKSTCLNWLSINLSRDQLIKSVIWLIADVVNKNVIEGVYPLVGFHGESGTGLLPSIFAIEESVEGKMVGEVGRPEKSVAIKNAQNMLDTYKKVSHPQTIGTLVEQTV